MVRLIRVLMELVIHVKTIRSPTSSIRVRWQIEKCQCLLAEMKDVLKQASVNDDRLTTLEAEYYSSLPHKPAAKRSPLNTLKHIAAEENVCQVCGGCYLPIAFGSQVDVSSFLCTDNIYSIFYTCICCESLLWWCEYVISCCETWQTFWKAVTGNQKLGLLPSTVLSDATYRNCSQIQYDTTNSAILFYPQTTGLGHVFNTF